MTKIKIQDVKKAVDIGREVLPFVEPIIREHGPEVANQVAKKAKEASKAADDKRKSILEKVQQGKDSQDQKKALEEARRRAIASSLPPIRAKEFFKCFEDGVSNVNNLNNGYMAISGCYAILTLKSEREKDLSNYKDVYVGCSKSLGFDVYLQLRGFGNVDVYADYKFKEPMRILVFPCDEADMPEKFSSLVENLRSADSYNMWDLVSSNSFDR